MIICHNLTYVIAGLTRNLISSKTLLFNNLNPSMLLIKFSIFLHFSLFEIAGQARNDNFNRIIT